VNGSRLRISEPLMNFRERTFPWILSSDTDRRLADGISGGQLSAYCQLGLIRFIQQEQARRPAPHVWTGCLRIEFGEIGLKSFENALKPN